MTCFTQERDAARYPIAALLFLALLVLWPLDGRAQDSVGVIVDLRGAAQIGASGRFETASIGSSIAIGNHLRTGDRGQLRAALHDGTILQLGADTEVSVDRHSLEADSGRFETTVTLLRGRLQPNVGGQEQGHVRITSATATADAGQGEFVVEYDEPAGVTHVTGISGNVAVHSTLDPSGSEVLVTAQQVTSVRKGTAPEPLRPVERLSVRQVGQENGVLGSSLPEAALWGEQLLSGTTVGTHESLAAAKQGVVPAEVNIPPRQSSVKQGNDVSSILGQNLSDGVRVGIDLGH